MVLLLGTPLKQPERPASSLVDTPQSPAMPDYDKLLTDTQLFTLTKLHPDVQSPPKAGLTMVRSSAEPARFHGARQAARRVGDHLYSMIEGEPENEGSLT